MDLEELNRRLRQAAKLGDKAQVDAQDKHGWRKPGAKDSGRRNRSRPGEKGAVLAIAR